MILIKFKFISKTYNLYNDIKKNENEIYRPYINFGFSEVDINDQNEYELEGHLEEEYQDSSCITMIIAHPQLETDKDLAYQRVSEIVIDYCSSLTEKAYPIECKNKIGQIIAEFTLILTKVTFSNLDSKFNIYNSKKKEIKPQMMDVRHHQRKIEELKEEKKKERFDQQNFEEKMFNFLQKHFQNRWKGTENMILLNNNFGFDGKTPFYPFCDMKLPLTNSKYWIRMFNYVLYLKHGAETNRSIKLEDYYNSLDLKERLIIKMDMLTIVAACCYYLFDTVQIANKYSKKLEPIEDFCPIYHTWSGDCEVF
jgi:hypothetical protein